MSHCLVCGERTDVSRDPTALVTVRRGLTERGGTVSAHVGCRRRGAAWVADEALPWTDRGPPFE